MPEYTIYFRYDGNFITATFLQNGIVVKKDWFIPFETDLNYVVRNWTMEGVLPA